MGVREFSIRVSYKEFAMKLCRLFAAAFSLFALVADPQDVQSDENVDEVSTFVQSFIRGDSNDDGELNISDPIDSIEYLFGGDANPPHCMKSVDANDDGRYDISDPVAVLNFLFSGGPEPNPPLGVCSFDETEDDLSCDSYNHCSEFSEV